MAKLAYVNDDDFDTTIVAIDEVVLLDFTADWCEPCRAMEPALEELAAEFDGRLRILKVDLDESPDVTARFRVMSIPTLIFLKNGDPVKRLQGPQPKDTLSGQITDTLAGAGAPIDAGAAISDHSSSTGTAPSTGPSELGA